MTRLSPLPHVRRRDRRAARARAASRSPRIRSKQDGQHQARPAPVRRPPAAASSSRSPSSPASASTAACSPTSPGSRPSTRSSSPTATRWTTSTPPTASTRSASPPTSSPTGRRRHLERHRPARRLGRAQAERAARAVPLGRLRRRRRPRPRQPPAPLLEPLRHEGRASRRTTVDTIFCPTARHADDSDAPGRAADRRDHSPTATSTPTTLPRRPAAATAVVVVSGGDEHPRRRRPQRRPRRQRLRRHRGPHLAGPAGHRDRRRRLPQPVVRAP